MIVLLLQISPDSDSEKPFKIGRYLTKLFKAIFLATLYTYIVSHFVRYDADGFLSVKVAMYRRVIQQSILSERNGTPMFRCC